MTNFIYKYDFFCHYYLLREIMWLTTSMEEILIKIGNGRSNLFRMGLGCSEKEKNKVKEEFREKEERIIQKMTLLSFLCSCPPVIPRSWFPLTSNTSAFSVNLRTQIHSSASTNIFTQKLDTTLLSIAESLYEDELWAAACLRVRSFHQFRPDTFGVQVSLSF